MLPGNTSLRDLIERDGNFAPLVLNWLLRWEQHTERSSSFPTQHVNYGRAREQILAHVSIVKLALYNTFCSERPFKLDELWHTVLATVEITPNEIFDIVGDTSVTRAWLPLCASTIDAFEHIDVMSVSNTEIKTAALALLARKLDTQSQVLDVEAVCAEPQVVLPACFPPPASTPSPADWTVVLHEAGIDSAEVREWFQAKRIPYRLLHAKYTASLAGGTQYDDIIRGWPLDYEQQDALEAYLESHPPNKASS